MSTNNAVENPAVAADDDVEAGGELVLSPTPSLDEATALLINPSPDAEPAATTPAVAPSHRSDTTTNRRGGIVTIHRLDEYPGDSLTEKVDALIQKHAVVVFGKTDSPFSQEVKDLLLQSTQPLGVPVYSLDVEAVPRGKEIFQYLRDKTNRSSLPLVFISTKFVGGCNDIKNLHANGKLEKNYLKGLPGATTARNTPQRQQEQQQQQQQHPLNISNITADRSSIRSGNTNNNRRRRRRRIASMMNHPPFWFPYSVDRHVTRVVAAQVLLLSVLSAAFLKQWGRYLAVALLVDFGLFFVAGPSISPLGMVATLATCKVTPDLKPGPPTQFAAFCGAFLSGMAVVFFFVDFNKHEVVGAFFMAILALVAAVEAFLGHSLGRILFNYVIQLGIIPEAVNHMHNVTQEEMMTTWNYRYQDSDAPVPVRVNTNPKSDIALKYKRKTAAWSKDDFDPIRHMQISHFAMPLAISGLAVAFKVASDWSGPYGEATIRQPRSVIVSDTWFHVISFMGAFVFIFFFLLYATRMYMFPLKCWKEWDCPVRSSGFGMIPTTVMFFAFLIYDEISKREPGGDEENPQTFARVLWWIGAVGHSLLTVAKFGEWVGRRMELEHVHPHWMMFPVGLAVAALVGPVVGVFADDNARSAGGSNALLARFFYSFAWLLWITLFVVTFFKVVTQHNSDNRLRHGVFFWIATPCTLGLAEYAICYSSNVLDRNTCEEVFAEKYFIGLFLFMSLVWATLPPFNFFGRARFDMGYWIECFALSMLASCAALFYTLNGWPISQTLQSIALVVASVANTVALLHTATACVRQHGVFTPDVKWNPLSFTKLTHEAFRCSIEALRDYIDEVDLEDDSAEAKETLGLFASHFSRFCIVYEEHVKHENSVILKTFNDYFPKHTRRYYEDYKQDPIMVGKWQKTLNVLIDTNSTMDDRNSALDELRSGLPDFFSSFEDHLTECDANLEPIGQKYLPLEIAKQMSRDVWKITPANKWELVIPFIILNLPRHGLCVCYLRTLCWSLPAQAQQIGAMLYRHVDAAMWERLRVEVPEIVPRGAYAWKRYY